MRPALFSDMTVSGTISRRTATVQPIITAQYGAPVTSWAHSYSCAPCAPKLSQKPSSSLPTTSTVFSTAACGAASLGVEKKRRERAPTCKRLAVLVLVKATAGQTPKTRDGGPTNLIDDNSVILIISSSVQQVTPSHRPTQFS